MKIQVCSGKSCSERFSEYIIDRLENDVKKFELEDMEVMKSPCMGNCQKWPNIKIESERFEKMNPAKASELLFKKLPKKWN